MHLREQTVGELGGRFAKVELDDVESNEVVDKGGNARSSC